PAVERVAYPDASGALRTGYLVETWGKDLRYTLVDEAGAIVSSELRTQSDSYNVFAEDPLKTPQAVASGGAGWLGSGSQLDTNISRPNHKDRPHSDRTHQHRA